MNKTFINVLLISAVWIVIQSNAAVAAMVAIEQNIELGCEIHLRGPIVEGDAVQLRSALDSLGGQLSYGNTNTESLRICFDSAGGSYEEGLNIARLLIGLDPGYPSTIGSAVPGNAVCLSACAVAFMGGTMSDEPGYRTPDRIIQPGAQLGFHAPMLVVSPDQYSEAEVTQAYRIALVSVAEIIGLVNDGMYHFPLSLLQEMLDAPPDEMFYIETFSHAFRWNIDIKTPGIYRGERDKVLRGICEAVDARLHDFELDRLVGYSLKTWDSTLAISPSSHQNGLEIRIASGFGPASDPGHTLPCALFLASPPADRMGIIGSAQIREISPNEPWGFALIGTHLSYPPDMHIEQASQAPFISYASFFSSLSGTRQNSRTSESYTIDQITSSLNALSISSFWKHNGSRMALVANGAQRNFFYVEPRTGLVDLGVRPGTLLFQGMRNGNGYTGTAVIFGANGCGAFPYAVSGTVGADQRSVTMWGRAPRISGDCSISGYREDSLTFTLE
jgi:hypothetical protein